MRPGLAGATPALCARSLRMALVPLAVILFGVACLVGWRWWKDPKPTVHGTAFFGGLILLITLLYAVGILKWEIRGSGLSMRQATKLRQEVYAKTEAVQAMGETFAGTAAYILAAMRSYSSGPPRDVYYQLGQQHEQLRAMLVELGTEPERVAKIVRPFTEAIRSDLAGEVILTINLVGARSGKISTEELRDLQAAIESAPIGQAVSAVRPRLEAKGLWNQDVEAKIIRFDDFRRTGHVKEGPPPALSGEGAG